MKQHVVILFGGKSGEHEVSIVSALSVYQALDKSKYDVTMVGIDKTGRWLLPDQSLLLAQKENPRLIKLNEIKNTVALIPCPEQKSLRSVSQQNGSLLPSAIKKIDVVFPVLHGTQGEDGTVQGLLELANLPYVGAGVLGSSLAMDKEMTKRVLHEAGIPVVPYITVRRKEFDRDVSAVVKVAKEKFGYPYFVKPCNLGSSVGIHKVKDDADALVKIRDAFLYDTKVIIEQAINARELECAVLGNDDPQASVIGEIIPAHEFYSYDAKYIDPNGAELSYPAKNLDQKTVDLIQSLAKKTFIATECAGMARVDFFLDKDTGKIYLNELNTIPGFTSISMYPKLWEASGLPYPKLLDRLIELALERYEQHQKIKMTYAGEWNE